MRFVVVGGSGSSTPELVDALNTWPGGVERRPPLTVVLVGRSAEKLAAVAAEGRARLMPGGPPVAIETELDHDVLYRVPTSCNQVRGGGRAATEDDQPHAVSPARRRHGS